MREFRTYGSVRGALNNERSYRDRFPPPAPFPMTDGRLLLMLPSPERPCPYECGGDWFGQDEACDQAADFRGGHQPDNGADHAAVRFGLVLSRLLSGALT